MYMITNLAGTENLTTLDSNLIFFYSKRRIIGLLFKWSIYWLMGIQRNCNQDVVASENKLYLPQIKGREREHIVYPIQQSVIQSVSQSVRWSICLACSSL
jgi:hypothetical protein